MAHERVGKRVRVYWSEEEEWFEGTIQEFNQSQGYYIVYDDGDERWESEGQPMLVEGEEEAQTAANYEELRDSDRTPQMMEPPASPGSDYDDDYEGMEQSESHQQPEDTTNHTTGDEIQQQHEVINYSEDEVDQDTYQQEKEEDQQDHSQSESKDDHAENGIEDHGGEDVDDASDDQSNKAIGRRLQNILGTDDGARNPEKFSSWAAAEPKDSLNYDYMDRDKLHAQDKRWQRQVELDFIMEKAQTKYQQQHQMVEEVMEIQEAVATLKTQVDTLNKSVLRLDILNKKDQHTLNRTSSKPSTQNNNNDHDDGGKNRKEQELELLTQHRDRLQADKHRLSHELNTLNQQELELDKEMKDQQSKWEYAIATQLFHRQMDKKNAIQAQQAVLEMKRRLKALELSREEEEQWVCYQARQELTQLQIAIQILRDQNGEGSRGLAETRASKSSSTAVCEYLTKKIEKQKSKLQQLQDEVDRRRNDYEVMLVSGGNESLRRRVQELQKLVFLCKSQATHVKKAERIAKRKGEQVDMEFQRRLFSEQTETEIMLKRVPKQ
ncbi:hypothetical protein JG688_00005405 [Phytophthora aleatoria]|uniref:Tudor domain-containing protein n=1 Tax=Phytophthora aleatoria TaxID=2496075 RepID=A0A8J5IMJ3_9STRA|nr:hypothetical protein JG688_00005405 [Phytophthora aleatoria]